MFYDRRWAEHRFANRLKLMRTVAILDRLSRLDLKEPRIIEIGCGTGWLSGILAQFGPTTGVDLSDAAIAGARTRYPSVTFVAADVSSPTFTAAGPFDVAVSHEVIEHIEDQAAHMKMVAELLVQNGHLILTTPNGRFRSEGGQLIERHVTGAQLRALLRPHFDIVEQGSVILSGWPRRFPVLARWNCGRHLVATARKR